MHWGQFGRLRSLPARTVRAKRPFFTPLFSRFAVSWGIGRAMSRNQRNSTFIGRFQRVVSHGSHRQLLSPSTLNSLTRNEPQSGRFSMKRPLMSPFLSVFLSSWAGNCGRSGNTLQNENRTGRSSQVWFLNHTEPRNAIPWFKGRSKAICAWRDRKLGERDLLDKIGGICLFPQDRSLRSRVMGERLTEDEEYICPVRPKKQRSIPPFGEYWNILAITHAVALNMLHKRKTGSRGFATGLIEICAPKEYLGFMYGSDDPLGAPYFKDNGSTYPLHMAASGEQVIIEYLARLTYPSPMNHSIVLIDEPEIHLHPGWIRQLYRALTKNRYWQSVHSYDAFN